VPIPVVLDEFRRLDPGDPVEWEASGARYTLRAATADDLRETMLEPDDGDAPRRLLGRCLSVNGKPPAEAFAIASADPQIAERFDRLHEQAELACEVRCPQCATADVVDLDIAQFLWDEVRHAALRLLRDVHDLASSYGWSEAAILAMTDQRRRAYLEIVWA
jgi:hypothetical protein